MKKFCVITGSRAEYGLLRYLIKAIKDDSNLELQIIATGMHLSSEFGMTYKDIEQDGFTINKKVDILLSSNDPSGVSKSTGLGISRFTDALRELSPDMIIVLGDRFEILAATIASMFLNIPISHINGGETTEGAFDEAIRHSITKMSWWHFPAAEEYKKRILQLGEDESRVFLVGGLSVDSIKNSKLLSKNVLSEKLNFNFGSKNLMVTYHPVTLERNLSKKYFGRLLDALDTLTDTKIIFTSPNADPDSRIINNMINDYISAKKETSTYFKSMGQLNYLSSLQYVDAIVGNSSSGLSEAPTFKIGTINIGNRQKGRLKANSVIDTIPEKRAIIKSIEKLYSKDFQEKLNKVQNPYGDGNATKKIMKILKSKSIPKSLIKEFINI